MTYEEISEKYPVGKVLYEDVDVIVHHLPYYSPLDLACYRGKYDKVEVISCMTCDCYAYKKTEFKVEGWLYDGEEWSPAYDTWDGWMPYSDEKLEEFKKMTKEQNEVDK